MKYLSLLVILFISLQSNAQFQGHVYGEDSSIVITQGGVQKILAWCGGFNSPQFAMADLNRDGTKDLVVYEQDQFAVKTFINYGSPSAPDYRYRPEYSDNFPLCSTYLIMRDYNGDGIDDLFETGGIGFTAHTGYYNAANQLCFRDYKSLYYDNDIRLIGSINAEANPGDIPAIVDVDGDGDLDFLCYYGGGYYMSWYQNMQVEKSLPKDSIVIRLADHCWGKMIQSTIRTHELGISCDNSSLMRTLNNDPSGNLKITDGGNAPCLLDIDGDGDFDVLDGHRAFNNVVFLRNGKFPSGRVDSMVYQDTTWSSLGDTVDVAQWPAVFHEDIDVNQDGKRDLLISPHAPTAAENYKCSHYYKNIGTDAVPIFQYQSDTFLVSDAIDLGSNSYPFFYDYDKDGKPDLFVGSRGFYDAPSGQYYARVMYLHNISTLGKPAFEILNNDFLGLAAQKYTGIAVTIGDIDNDGKDDFVFGHTDGTIGWIKNTAATASATPVWNTAPTAVLDASATAIQTYGYAAPLVYDMNADGVNDLIIGDQSGYLFYYQNTSTIPGSSSFVYTNNQLGLAKSDPEMIVSGNSTPFIGRMDNSSRPYLVMGSRSGRIFRYTGFEGGNVYSAYTRLDSAYSFILSKIPNYTSYFSAPAIADADGDGKFEMVVGNIHGGLFLYHQNETVNIEELNKSELTQLILFPNPAKQEINLGLNQTNLPRGTPIYFYNTIGQVVMKIEAKGLGGFEKIDISTLQEGAYFCVLMIDNVRYSSFFTK